MEDNLLASKQVSKQARNSSIELLKILAIILIVFSHGMPNGAKELNNCVIDLDFADNIQYYIIQIFSNFGQIGNDIFLVCSFWFLSNSDSVRTEKISNLVSDAVFVSIASFCIWSLLGYRFSMNYVIKQFFPVIFGNSWFLSCYLLMYLIHPMFNIYLNKISKRAHFNLCLVLLCLYSGVYFVLRNSGAFYNELIGFFVIYVTTAYVKKYSMKKLISHWTVLFGAGVLSWLCLNALSNVVGKIVGNGITMRWNIFINPCFILISFGLLGLSLSEPVTNKWINYLSSLSLLIYIIHTNRIVRDYVRFDFFNFIYNTYTYEYILLWVIVFAIISLIYGLLLSVLYDKTIRNVIHRFFYTLFFKISAPLSSVFGKLEFMISDKVEEEG